MPSVHRLSFPNGIVTMPVRPDSLTSRALLWAVTGLLLPAILAFAPARATTQAVVPVATASIETDVVIVGAGLAGLTAAYRLHEVGLSVIVLELSDYQGVACARPAIRRV